MLSAVPMDQAQRALAIALVSYLLIPLRLSASRERSGAYVTRALFIGSLVGFFFFTTQYLQIVLGMGSLTAGLAFLPMTVTTFVAALAARAIARRVGHGACASIACVLVARRLATCSTWRRPRSSSRSARS